MENNEKDEVLEQEAKVEETVDQAQEIKEEPVKEEPTYQETAYVAPKQENAVFGVFAKLSMILGIFLLIFGILSSIGFAVCGVILQGWIDGTISAPSSDDTVKAIVDGYNAFQGTTIAFLVLGFVNLAFGIVGVLGQRRRGKAIAGIVLSGILIVEVGSVLIMGPNSTFKDAAEFVKAWNQYH